MKFIVTGSEGFIGKALAFELQRRGAEVIGIDRKNGTEAKDIAKYLANDDIDGVFHLAAQTSVFNENIKQIVEDNIETFIIVCNACKEKHVKLVYASSSTANECNTTSMYGISKHFNEQYASIYYPRATGVRLHNVYGPNPRQGTLLWCLMNQEKVKLYNGGENVRHFTYIGDIVGGLVYAYGSNRKLLNVANPEKSQILNFAKIVSSYNGVEIEVISNKKEFDNLEQSVDDTIYTVPLSYLTIHEGLGLTMEVEQSSKKGFAGTK